MSLIAGLAMWSAAAGGELVSRIDHVTVFPAHALVRRVARAPAAGGKLVIGGLPAGLDADTLRVRCEGAQVLGIDARERNLAAASDPRVEAARVTVRELERELRAVDDEIALQVALEKQAGGLLALERRAHAAQLAEGKVDAAAWSRNLQFIAGELAATRKALRELGWKRAGVEQRLADARLAAGRTDLASGVRVREVEVELAAGGADSALSLEYVVAGAGWKPLYELRAANDARTVQLGYRAAVWQSTGEDWSEVELALSTARPELGAQAPEPWSPWLYVQEKPARGRVTLGADASAPAPASEVADGEDRAEERHQDRSAVVVSQGLSLRFVLPGRETVPSRDEPVNVLIGDAALTCAPEYFAAPALDTNVWLRGRTVNTSAWTLLAGEATVFFGADFVGRARIDEVQPGSEFTLHLGPDPALALERTLLTDLTSSGGLFSSKTSRQEGFRIRIENAGAAVARADGSALVYVREALPRSTDERIVVELSQANPKPLADARWKKERDEKGIATWALSVPRGGEAVLSYATTIRFPEGSRVVR